MLKEESNESGFVVGKEDDYDDDREVASWLMLNPGKDGDNHNNGFLFGVEYLDLVDYSSSFDNQFEDQYSQYQRSFGGEDGVVPLQLEESTSHLKQSHHNYGHYMNYNGSSVDINAVPESTESDTTVQHSKETTDQVSGLPTQKLTRADREARVLRYREKKKRRKFEKTIRYASRKAYAEIRPRIKGRFAKRIETEADAQQLFSTSLMPYGVVPSF
ncbi:hypothetical protein N665_0445s0009 [Sinapis alba]|nr:hypothetical protein N665_0445s0009 [Sinapis alba]